MSPDLAAYASGSTEPWTVNLIVALMNAVHARRILELGGYIGLTSEQLARHKATGAELVVVESEPERVAACQQRLDGFPHVEVVQDDAEHFLRTYTGEPFDFAFVDDDHTREHVARELDLLKPLMASKGIICVHDVCGHFNLGPVVIARGGYILDLPQLHVAGGLGVIQTR